MRRAHCLCLLLLLFGLLWLGYALAVSPLTRFGAAHGGGMIERLTLGYATDAGDFVKYRLRDALVLLTAAGLFLAVIGLLADILSNAGVSRSRRWIGLACATFVLANVWLALACHTTLFWFVFWQGKTNTTNLARIEMKALLLRESRARWKAAILGNSQAHRQLNDQLLNELLTTNLHTSELHWPGSHAYDIYLVHHNLNPAIAQLMICYVSEMTFYDPAHADSVSSFSASETCRISRNSPSRRR